MMDFIVRRVVILAAAIAVFKVACAVMSVAVKMFFRLFRQGRTGNRRSWPLPGPTRPQGGLGKAPAGAPLDLHRLSAR